MSSPTGENGTHITNGTASPHGGDFVRTLARRLSRFDWTNVEHDVLKVLYESVIGSETRKQLGEYYTPDWLAEQVVSTAVTDPLNQRVLDPACGSGTFLFHAVRRYLNAAAAAGIS
ncbi:MAG TPA: N-6 DNA methylase, partial [Pseudonocardiaceae bacterium]|nr:N-6 DNA methylase [Pseudonocardiaceae bacterium]